MENCEKSPDVIKKMVQEGNVYVGLLFDLNEKLWSDKISFRVYTFAFHKSGKRSVFNYSMVVGLKDTMTDKTKMPFNLF